MNTKILGEAEFEEEKKGRAEVLFIGYIIGILKIFSGINFLVAVSRYDVYQSFI